MLIALLLSVGLNNLRFSLVFTYSCVPGLSRIATDASIDFVLCLRLW